MGRSTLSAILAVWLASIGCQLGGEPAVTASPRRFDSALWKSADGSADVRCDMVADLRRRVGLVGRTRAELIELLGEPESDRQGLDHHHLCPRFMDVWILEVRWQDGRVSSTRIRDT